MVRDAFAGQAFVILQISIDPSYDTAARMQTYRTTNGITWRMASDTAGLAVSTAYGVNAAPWTFIIDANGVIQKDYKGLTNAATMISFITPLIPLTELTLQGARAWYWTSSTSVDSVARGDVDSDGFMEIVTGGHADTRAQLCVWNGATLTVENVKTWYWTGSTYVNSVAVGDVDGDGGVEIVTGGSFYEGTRRVAQLCVWNGATLALENVRTWYWTTSTNIYSVAVGNVDGDGGVEIVTGGFHNDGTRDVAQLCVWNGATLALENVKTWYWTGSTVINSIAVGNVDADGNFEIVTGGYYLDGIRAVAQLCVWNGATLALENVKTWYWTSSTYINSIAVGNVDADGNFEIVTGGYYSDSDGYLHAQLCVWNGATLALENLRVWYWAYGALINSVAVGDVDGDSRVEIVTGGHYSYSFSIAQLCVWDGETLALGNVEVWSWSSAGKTAGNFFTSVAVGDVDSDGKVEIVTGVNYWDGARNVAQLCVWT